MKRSSPDGCPVLRYINVGPVHLLMLALILAERVSFPSVAETAAVWIGGPSRGFPFSECAIQRPPGMNRGGPVRCPGSRHP